MTLKNINQLEKEIEELVKMLDEEEGSSWASENETYMEEQRKKLDDLNIKLQTLQEVCEKIKRMPKRWIKIDKNTQEEYVNIEELLKEFQGEEK